LAHSDLRFILIINPNSGPGAAPWWPNADYVRELRRLSAYANVQMVGYVRATYCQRPIDDVFEDIETYAAWRNSNVCPGLGVDGIFIDETVNLYSPQAKQYLDSIDDRIVATDGIGGFRLVG
jgi:hypothetical protein